MTLLALGLFIYTPSSISSFVNYQCGIETQTSFIVLCLFFESCDQIRFLSHRAICNHLRVFYLISKFFFFFVCGVKLEIKKKLQGYGIINTQQLWLNTIRNRRINSKRVTTNFGILGQKMGTFVALPNDIANRWLTHLMKHGPSIENQGVQIMVSVH